MIENYFSPSERVYEILMIKCFNVYKFTVLFDIEKLILINLLNA